jgi:hypothetical protein
MDKYEFKEKVRTEEWRQDYEINMKAKFLPSSSLLSSCLLSFFPPHKI